jgi:hypothetical protein
VPRGIGAVVKPSPVLVGGGELLAPLIAHRRGLGKYFAASAVDVVGHQKIVRAVDRQSYRPEQGRLSRRPYCTVAPPQPGGVKSGSTVRKLAADGRSATSELARRRHYRACPTFRPFEVCAIARFSRWFAPATEC